jgi:nucleoside-diphosphate-sugar epimerase
MRFNLDGYKVLFVPDVDVTHFQGHSSKQRPVRVMWHMHKGMMRFYRKFFLRSYPLPLTVLVTLGVWFRFFVLVLQYLVSSFTSALKNAYSRVKNKFFSSSDDNLDASFLAFRPGNLDRKGHVLVLGARSQIGHFLIPRLVNEGYEVTAASRKNIKNNDIEGVSWKCLDMSSEGELDLPDGCTTIVSLAPIWLLANRIPEFADKGVDRIIVFSSTSRFTKLDSSSDADRSLAERLAEAEAALVAECARKSIQWTLFRPTMVYGCGMDQNIFSIAGFIRKFGCFIMAGEGRGCRQPVHADDLADACVKALMNSKTHQKDYNLSGGETLSYNKMVELVFQLLGRKPRICSINRKFLHGMTRVVSFLPGFKHVSPAMVDRMEVDLCFDHTPAINDFDYSPRMFLETSFYEGELGRKAYNPGINEKYLAELEGKRVLVTGAGGFIGFSMCRYLVNRGCEVHVVLRDIRQLHDLGQKINPLIVDDLVDVHNWSELLTDIDVVVHLAGYVHERAGNLTEEAKQQCIRLNVDVTRSIADAAAGCGIERLIYVSSVKVHGESSNLDEPVTESMNLYPEGTYAKSKLTAENILRKVSSSSGMETVIIRPPLVYGPGVKANFLRLMKLVEKGIPLPLAAVDNRRSFVYLENLVDLLALSIVHPAAGGETFLVSDGEDVSTPMLINQLAAHFGIQPKLFPISVPVMRLLAAVGGERSTVDRLVQSLVINSGHARQTLNWEPPYSMEHGISKTVYWYQQLYDPVQARQYQLAAYASSW